MNSKSIKYLMAPLLAFVFVVGVASQAFSEETLILGEAQNSDDAIPEESVTDEYDAYRRIVFLQGCQLDSKTAWRWLALAKKLRPDPDASRSSAEGILKTRSIVSQLAALAMIYTGQAKVFKSELMPNIINLEAFDNWVKEPCDNCGGAFSYVDLFDYTTAKKGTGKVKEDCNHCKGTGQCTNNGCVGGQVEIQIQAMGSSSPGSGGVRGVKYRKCESCRGTGYCRFCNGRGYFEKTCPKCEGKGARMTKTHIAHVYGSLLPYATANINGDIDKMQAEKKKKEEIKKNSIDPRSIETTPYDNETNKYVWAKEDFGILKKVVRQTRKTIAIYVDTTAVSKQGGDNWSQLATSLLSDIQSQLGELEYLRTTTTAPDLIDFINASFDGGKRAVLDVPDYILVVRLVGITIGEHSVYQPVGVKVYFELYDRDAGAARFAKTISKKDSYSKPGAAADSVQELFSEIAREYMELIADKVGPIGFVMETRGGGEYAYISLGTDAGLRAGTHVQILEKRKDDGGLGDLIVSSYAKAGGSRQMGKGDVGTLGRRENFDFISVADGRVVESVLPEWKNAWIVIDNFNKKSPRVKKGMAVRLVPVPREGRIVAPGNRNY